jgi:hypothetical protein
MKISLGCSHRSDPQNTGSLWPSVPSTANTSRSIVVPFNSDLGYDYQSPYEEDERIDEDREEIVIEGKSQRKLGRKPCKRQKRRNGRERN